MNAPEEIFVLDRRVRLLQPSGGFRTSLDSVMLAAACRAGAGSRLLDMGSGVGGAAFCLLARVPDCHVTGVEIQPEYHALAERNIILNGAEGRAAFVCADVLAYEAERFDHVICNPPYLESGTHTRSPDEGRAMALGFTTPHPNPLPGGERECDITPSPPRGEGRGEGMSAWLNTAFRLLKSNGTLTLIHRADRLDKIILGLGKRFGAVEIIPLWPRAGEPAKRVIVRAIKDRRSPAILHPGLILHDGENYTADAEAVLRGAKPLYI